MGISPRRPGLEPGPVLVDFVGDRVVPGQVFLQVVRLLPVSIVVPLLLTHLHLLKPFLPNKRATNSDAVSKLTSIDKQQQFHFFRVQLFKHWILYFPRSREPRTGSTKVCVTCMTILTVP